MVTRTIPSLFPLVNEREIYTRKTAKGSLMRRLAMMQNWIWSKAVRVYAAHGYEGYGNRLQHIKATYGLGQTVDAAVLVDAPDGGSKVLPLVSFAVPPNWGAARRLKVQGRSNLQKAAGVGTYGEIIVALYTMDEVSIGVYSTDRYTSAGDNDWTVTLNVPQDKMYQCKVFLRFVDGATSNENATTDSFNCTFVSARYETGTAVEIGGDTPVATWAPTDDVSMDADHSYNAAILQRILRNTLHLYCYRPPELCQSYIGQQWNNTSTFVEVGRYIVYLPHMVTEIKGKLIAYCTHGGAGNEVRILVGGVVKETFTALAVGTTELTLAAISGLTSGQEHTITIEAKSTAASADWGTFVNGVSVWENALTMNLGSVGAVPAAYQPIDEAGLRGDDPIVWSTNAQGQRSGLKWLILNDRWLARHRLRHLIGDWRHKVYKRIQLSHGVGATSTMIDAEQDWTRGPEIIDYQLTRPKNITVRGSVAGDDDADGYGGFSTGAASAHDGTSNSYASGNNWPYGQIDFPRHGRRLGKYWIYRAASTQTHQQESPATWQLICRGRRLRPAAMWPTPSTFGGPYEEEKPYKNTGYFLPLYNTTEQLKVAITGEEGSVNLSSGVTNLGTETTPGWRAPGIGNHTNADNYFTIRGRLPGQPGRINNVQHVRAEGWLFEIELNSVYLADNPLNDEALAALS